MSRVWVDWIRTGVSLRTSRIDENLQVGCTKDGRHGLAEEDNMDKDRCSRRDGDGETGMGNARALRNVGGD